jgi:hypothetical protein
MLILSCICILVAGLWKKGRGKVRGTLAVFYPIVVPPVWMVRLKPRVRFNAKLILPCTKTSSLGPNYVS